LYFIKGVNNLRKDNKKTLENENEELKDKEFMSRRSFLVGAGTVLAGTAIGGGLLAGCKPETVTQTVEVTKTKTDTTTLEVPTTVSINDTSSWLPDSWDYETDVVVIGYGGAGAVTAVSAHDAGAEVIILEKQLQDTAEKVNQTNSTRICRAACMNFKSEQGAVDFLTAASRGATPDDVIESWAKYATHTKEWIESIGGTMNDMPTNSSEYPYAVFPEGENYIPYVHKDYGAGLWTTLSSAVNSRSIQVIYNAPANKLVYNPNSGEVIGVTANQGGKEINIKARKGVVLSCGGFEFNFKMLDTFIWAHPCRFISNPGNTGDGITMAQAVGAALWHMPVIGGWPVSYIDELGVGLTSWGAQPYMWVNKYGKRFMGGPTANSNFTAGTIPGHMASYGTFYWDFTLCDFPAVPFFSIFDQTVINKGPVVDSAVLDLTGDYKWSSDNSVEIAKGWVFKGETIEELAANIAKDPDAAGKMDAANLADTLTKYNQYCADGFDPEFGVVASTLTPLSTPPYYAIKMYPGCFNTFGGPKRDANGRVVDSFDAPISRLYSAGELGSIMGFLYAGGGWNICEVVTSGQIAGKHAASLTSWE
jgi:succinate dehydrogenase/fumarate reductase flavoprotein subunit